MLIDADSGYHKLKLDKTSSYLTTFVCKVGRYRYSRLPFDAALEEDMLQQKIYDIFKDLPYVFDTADNILIIGYDSDGHDHDTMLR